MDTHTLRARTSSQPDYKVARLIGISLVAKTTIKAEDIHVGMSEGPTAEAAATATATTETAEATLVTTRDRHRIGGHETDVTIAAVSALGEGTRSEQSQAHHQAEN